MKNDINEKLIKLSKSKFRSSFHLNKKMINFIDEKGMDVIKKHTVDFIIEKLSPAFPLNDGKQTPMKNHPTFIAMHATACCCRSCIEKWHGISKGKELTKDEKNYIYKLIITWIEKEYDKGNNMKEINDYLIYNREVCKIINIKKINNEKNYILESTNDNTLKITIPEDKINLLTRNLLSDKEIKDLLIKIPDIDILDIESKNLENEYKLLLQDNTLESLITIIKTSYLRNKIRQDNDKKSSDNDLYYFELAEHYLYNEIAYSKKISYNDAKEYVLNFLSR